MRLEELREKSLKDGSFLRYFESLKNDDKIYSKYIYHSTKLEGNTYSEADTLTLLKTGDISTDYTLNDSYEIQDLKNAVDFMYESLEIDYIDPDFLKELHALVVYHNDADLPGSFKIDNNYTGYNGSRVAYADADDVPFLIVEMCGIYNNSDKTLKDMADLVCKFIAIHPFRDGNGRVQRLLLNWVLLKNNWAPIIIKVEEKEEYIYVLNEYRVTQDSSEFEDFLLKKLKEAYSYMLEDN